MVSTRRFKDLKVACDSDIVPLKQIEVIPRLVQLEEVNSSGVGDSFNAAGRIAPARTHRP